MVDGLLLLLFMVLLLLFIILTISIYGGWFIPIYTTYYYLNSYL